MNNLLNTEIEIDAENEELKSQIYAHFRRLGIDELLKTDGVTEICINDPKNIFYEQYSVWKNIARQNVPLGDNSNEVIKALGKLLINSSGQTQGFDANNPMLSLTMPDGERVQLVRQPAAEHASLTIRIPSKQIFTMDEYAEKGLFKKIKQTDGITDEDRELKELLAKEDYQQFMEKAVA
ncbi:MAG: Flp pilus assembly complex ATPase component TadA, partial [Neisseriaceae bacterium]|nr:Flp pilus assembly complex ATPase component TadA [Neisseriaceae bacterium]